MELKRAGALSILAAAMAATVYAGQTQDPAAKAASILAESRKALGGDDKIAAIKTLEIKGTARRGAGDVNIEGDMTIVMERPGKYLRKEQILLGNGGIDVVEGLNGAESWDEQKFSGGMNFDDGGDGGRRGGGPRGGGAPGQTPAAGATPDEAAKQAALAARQAEVARILLALFLTTDQPVKHTGTAVTPQMTAEVLEMTAPDGSAVRLIVDSKSYMPLMLQWTGIAQDPIAALAARAGFRGRGRGGRGGFGGFGGRQGPQQPQQPAAKVVSADELAKPTALRMYLQDYKTVNGIKLPHLLVRGTGDQVTEEWEIKSYKINPNLKADTFKK